MRNRVFMAALLLLTVSQVSAQSGSSESCDPYHLGESDFSLNTADLSLSSGSSADTVAMKQIGINPKVLLAIADNMSGNELEIATTANPETDLDAGIYAVVTRDNAPLPVYEGVCTESEVLEQLETGIRVTVLDGPIAGEGFAWWRIRNSDVTGWVIEGDGSEIWLHGT